MKINEVIVVEGKHDSETIKKYIQCDTLETQGTHLSKALLELLKQVNKTRGIIVFTDPDAPGDQIRARINEVIPNAKHAFMMKEKARTAKKVGIEHAKKEDILASLANVVTYQEKVEPSITMDTLFSLGLNGQPHSALLREQIGALLFIGKCNAKQLLKRLNMLAIDKQQLERILEKL